MNFLLDFEDYLNLLKYRRIKINLMINDFYKKQGGKMTHIYDNKLKFLLTLNYEYKDFIKNPNKFYPKWQPSYYATKQKYEDPVLDQDSLREKTREEKILLDNKVELLQDGEYIEQGKIIVVSAPEALLKKVWNKENHTWSEGAAPEELKEFYFDLINKYKAEILEVGFNFNKHQQKCREKDLALLGNAIAANEDTQPFATVPVTHWSFNDGDIVEMSLDELKKLRVDGAMFVQTVFIVEAQLKAASPDVLLSKEYFIEKVDELCVVKCFKNLV